MPLTEAADPPGRETVQGLVTYSNLTSQIREASNWVLVPAKGPQAVRCSGPCSGRIQYRQCYKYRSLESRRPNWSIFGPMDYDGAGKQVLKASHGHGD